MIKFLERYYRGKFAEEGTGEATKETSNEAVRRWYGLTGLGGDTEALVIPVTEESAMKVPAFFSGVRVLAESIAMLPLVTYRKVATGRERAEDLSEYSLLKDAINLRVTSYDWREAVIRKCIMRGNAFTELFWNTERTQVLAMRFIDHTDFEIIGDSVLLRHDNSLKQEIIPRDNLLHIKWITKDGVEGLGILKHATPALGFLIAAERYGMSFFANGALPFVILSHPGELGEAAAENIRQSWKKKYANRGMEPAVVEEGMNVHVLKVPNDEAQFLELRSFQLQEVARFLRITPHKLQDLERATFSNVVELNRAFVIDSLMPITVSIEQRIQLDMFRGRNDIFCEFLFDDFLRGNTRDRFETYKIGIESRVLTPNEVRRMENKNDLTPEQEAEFNRITKPGVVQ
jgi:HK97 family phage portal protein